MNETLMGNLNGEVASAKPRRGSLLSILAFVCAAGALALPTVAAESCIVSDPSGRLALIDSPLPDKFGTAVSSEDAALAAVYAWAIDWAETTSADWPAYACGFFFIMR